MFFSASESSSSALPSPEGNERKPLQAQAIPELPSGFASTFSPYEEILAELLGVQVPPEEVGARLAQEEGLLRHLAEVLGEALTQGVNEEIRRELAEVVSEISRPDLRSALSSAVEGESDLEKAQALVSAALEGLERVEELASRQDSSAQVPEGSGSEGFALQGSPDSLAHKPTEILMDTEAEDRLFGRLEESEKGLGLGVGWEKGEPVQPGQPSPAPKPEEAVSVPVRVGEGPIPAELCSRASWRDPWDRARVHRPAAASRTRIDSAGQRSPARVAGHGAPLFPDPYGGGGFMITAEEIERAQRAMARLREAIATVIVGQDQVVESSALGPFGPGSCAFGGRSRARENPTGPDFGPGPRPNLFPHPVHSRPHARRHPRHPSFLR
jgi:hypothetical protein